MQDINPTVKYVHLARVYMQAQRNRKKVFVLNLPPEDDVYGFNAKKNGCKNVKTYALTRKYNDSFDFQMLTSS